MCTYKTLKTIYVLLAQYSTPTHTRADRRNVTAMTRGVLWTGNGGDGEREAAQNEDKI